jgi:putative transposase
MARPYSQDLRDRVVAAVEGGTSRREAARIFKVGISTVIHWVRRFRETGSAAAKPMGGDYSSRLKGERAWLLARIERDNDVTLEEIRAELKAERGIRVGYGTVWRFYASEGISFKKNHACRRARAA